MEIALLAIPEGDVLARGSYLGGPDYEFVAATNGQVYFRAVGDGAVVWAGPDPESFRKIVAAWQRYRSQFRSNWSEAAEKEFFSRMRAEFEALGALPTDLPPDLEPLWSLLLFEAENGLG